jgi:heat shock protein HslJ
MKRILAILFVLVAIGLVAFWFSCPSAIAKEVAKQNWTLVGLTVDGEKIAIPRDAKITLEPMGGKRYIGRLGVNSLEVYLGINRKGKIKFPGEGGGVTEMAGPPHLMAFEEIYFAAFWKIRTAKLSGSKLVLEGPTVRLDYEGKPAPPLDNSSSPEDTVSSKS